MHKTVGVLSCTGDPWKCAEADIEAASAIGVKAVILDPGARARLDAAKVAFTSEQILARAAKSLEGVPLAVGPGVDPRSLGRLGLRAEVLASLRGGSIELQAEGRSFRFNPGRCDPEMVASMLTGLAAGHLAQGVDPGKSIEASVRILESSLRYWGCTPRLYAWRELEAYRGEVLAQVREAASILVSMGDRLVKAGLVPEVGINIAMALPAPYARTPMDVAAIPGRIRRGRGGLIPPIGCPEMGASSHLARAILEVMKFYPSLRAALNLLYTPRAVEAAEELGYVVSFYDRSVEPPEVKAREGATIPWGVRVALERIGGRRPDLIYHKGDWGKEAMITVFAPTAIEAVGKALSIASAILG